ncbi:hypothetical protein ACP275_02G010600 [Erythranthe tilingii]
MVKLCIIMMLIILSATPAAHGDGRRSTTGKGPNALKSWYRKLPHMKQKVTELHFYLHDVVSGPHPTNIPISMANFTATGSRFRFSPRASETLGPALATMDDLLTVGPTRNSTTVGRAQGLFGSTSLNEIGFHMTSNIVFTAGKYNGSTLSLAGHNPFLDEFRELPVVGGSGVFRLARGTALLDTVSYNVTSGDAIVEYDIMVLHY